MENVNGFIISIESKTKKLIGRYREVNEKLSQANEKIESLRKLTEEQQNSIHALNEKIKLLKIARTTEITEGTVDAKVRINELVREIDRCIGLLNR